MSRTKIIWNLHDYCSAQCSYCPTIFKHGDSPPEFHFYKKAATEIITYYTNIGKKIDWIFNGGEPLEIFDLPELLKLCKIDSSTINLTTNGGRLWLDWWAIEPYVDFLNLTYHHWQNPSLIRFIIQAFINKGKYINVSVPIRADMFNEDIDKVISLETEFGIHVNKQILYSHGFERSGFLNYSKEQIEILTGIQHTDNNPLTFKEQSEELKNTSPVFTGKLCNAGIEVLHIGHTGWVKGSMCNNKPLGNIWTGITFPDQPQVCRMQSCVYPEDQQIIKFD
jgi:organic radical activating enzyme